jgi:nucleotide-binding universal stress UspA family protein
VLLDDEAPWQGAFAHALEWAWHLRLPIHAWALPPCGAVEDPRRPIEPWDAVSLARLSTRSVSDAFVTRMNACAKVCTEWGVKLGLTRIEGVPSRWFGQHLRPDDLFLIGYAPDRAERLALVRQVLRQTAAVLLCPKVWRSTLSRMLVLYRSCQQNQQALATAIELCRCVGATPVVLTVARSQREGCRLQQPARAAFAEAGQSGHFDLLIGAEVAEAAARVARWRQCRLLVMGRYGRLPWTRWFGGSTTERLVGLADSLAVLTLPKRDFVDRGDDSCSKEATLADTSRWRASRGVSEQQVGRS